MGNSILKSTKQNKKNYIHQNRIREFVYMTNHHIKSFVNLLSCVLENLMLYNIPGSQAVCFQGTKKKKNWGENYIKEKVLFFKKLL